MKAIVANRFGGPDVIKIVDVPIPLPGRGEIRIAVHAAGVNPIDAENRGDGRWAGIELPWIPGYGQRRASTGNTSQRECDGESAGAVRYVCR